MRAAARRSISARSSTRSGVRAQRRAVGIVGVGGEAEAERRVVALAASRVKLREPRGAAEQQHQHAGRQRIERAQMADLAESEDAAHGVDDVVRRPALRLVDDQGAVERRGLRFSWHGRCGYFATPATSRESGRRGFFVWRRSSSMRWPYSSE